MSKDAIAKNGLARARDIFEGRPSQAQSTRLGLATIGDGLVCHFTDGSHEIISDMPIAMGGAIKSARSEKGSGGLGK